MADVAADVLLVALVGPPLHAAVLHLLLAAQAAVHEQTQERGPQDRSHPSPPRRPRINPSRERSPGTLVYRCAAGANAAFPGRIRFPSRLTVTQQQAEVLDVVGGESSELLERSTVFSYR